MSWIGSGTGWKIMITSNDGTGADTSDMTFHLTGPAPQDIRGSALYMSVSAIAMEVGWYNINENNNTFALTINGNWAQYTVPAGYYTTAATIVAAANNVMPASNALVYNQTTDTVRWSNTSANDVVFHGDNTDHVFLTEVLGFDASKQTIVATTGTLSSVNTTFALYTPAVYVHCPTISTENMDTRISSIHPQVIAMIPVPENLRTRWVSATPNTFAVKIAEDALRNFEIKFTDWKNRTMPMRNAPWCLEITIERREDEQEFAGGTKQDQDGEFYEEPLPMKRMRQQAPPLRSGVRHRFAGR